jgi:hypothetical protein
MGQEVPPIEDGIPAAHHLAGRDPAQEELQVRQTAQRILAAHLELPVGILSAAAQRRQPSPRRAFWPGMSLDLTGAALVDFDFERLSVVQGWFDGATFQGNAGFDGATFKGNARFGGATFQGKASFDEATFQGNASFGGTIFTSGNGGMGLAGARVLHMDSPDLNKRRVWPDGWTVRPDPAHPSHGTLVLAEQAVSPLDPTDNR